MVTANSCSLNHIESLSTTGAYEDVILGSFPKEAPPYKSLWTPFDNQTWILLLMSIISVSVTLYVIEKIWSKMRNEVNFKNDGICSIITIYLGKFYLYIMISALLMPLSTMLEGNLPSEWFHRSSFKARKILLFCWIIFCLIMTTVYS